MNQLDAWHRAGVIIAHMSGVAQDEASAGKDPARARKAQLVVSGRYARAASQVELPCRGAVLATSGDLVFWGDLNR